ncbi:MAG TPA: MBL fold metallo-hydrolase [Magnetospirillaceae bacterium]|nr:MBL fold metallo-hydrolase [Magnetospirillaceae bacterium]
MNVHIVDLGDGRAVIVDPGADPGRIVEALKGRKAVCIALTHGHLDHTAGIPGLLLILGSVPVAIHAADARYLGARGEETNLQTFTDIGARGFFGSFWTPLPEADILLEEGDLLPGTPIRLIHTPGHTSGSSCLYVDRDGILLSGDTLFRGGVGRTDNFDASEKTLMESIRNRILGLPPETQVLPGHGEPTTVAAERPWLL